MEAHSHWYDDIVKETSLHKDLYITMRMV